MSPTFRLRRVTDDDSQALTDLVAQSPDTGRVAFAPQFHLPLVSLIRSRHRDAVGVLAEADDAGVVGSAWIGFGTCRADGSLVPSALLNSLVVHPAFRRRGVAAALTQWRLERIAERSGDTLVMAGIQAGNAASMANAWKWASQVTRPITIAPVPMRTRRPRGGAEVTVRPVRADELDTVAEQLNDFYTNYELSEQHSADELADWLDRSPFESPVNHYLVATDRTGRLLAGAGIHEEARLTSLRVTSMPGALRLANRFVHVVPADDTMRNLRVQMLWFERGQLAAARLLWQTLRWEWREHGTGLVAAYDRRSPLRQVLRSPPWSPTTSISVALRTTRPLRDDRLVQPTL